MVLYSLCSALVLVKTLVKSMPPGMQRRDTDIGYSHSDNSRIVTATGSREESLQYSVVCSAMLCSPLNNKLPNPLYPHLPPSLTILLHGLAWIIQIQRQDISPAYITYSIIAHHLTFHRTFSLLFNNVPNFSKEIQVEQEFKLYE